MPDAPSWLGDHGRPRLGWHGRTRILLVALAVAAGLVLAGGCTLVAGGWYYANVLEDDALTPDHSPDRLNLEVVSVANGSVRLRPIAGTSSDLSRPEVFGLEWETGYGRIGPVLASEGETTVREFVPIIGTPSAGARARLDSAAYPNDLLLGLGLQRQEVRFKSELGEFSAWLVPAPGSGTWIVLAHGKDADRRDCLRLVPVLHELGVTVLLISYRNDPGEPQSPDGRHHYGATEWREVEGAVLFALENGATRVLVGGYSMGGALAVSFMQRSPLRGEVSGIILDSPMLDFETTVEFRGADRGAPRLLIEAGKRIAAWRFDLDWGEMNYLRRAGDMNVPILLFHGTADRDVPVKTSDALARQLPDVVTYVRVEGAGHVRSWNVDPAAYEAAVRGFFATLR